MSLNSQKIIKALKKSEHRRIFKQKEQSDEAYAIIVRHCRTAGNYQEFADKKKEAEELLDETKKQFELSENEYARFLGEWNKVKEANEKAQVLAQIGKKTEFVLADFNDKMAVLKKKKQELSNKRKAYFKQCTQTINEKKAIIKEMDAEIAEIDKCVEEVRLGLGVADYGKNSLMKTERFFELGIARTLKKQKSSFNTIGTTLLFEKNKETLKWEYDKFTTIVNESLLADTHISVKSTVQNEETSSFLLTINGELNLNVLDIQKKDSKSYAKSVSTGTADEVRTTDKHTKVDNKVDQEKNTDYKKTTGDARVKVSGGSKNVSDETKARQDISSKTYTVSEWEDHIKTKVDMEYGKVKHISTAITKIRTYRKDFDKLTPVEKKGVLDTITDIWDGAKDLVPFSDKLIKLNPVARVIDKGIKAISIIGDVADLASRGWNYFFGDDEPEFKLKDKEVTTIKDEIKTNIEKTMREQGWRKETITTDRNGSQTIYTQQKIDNDIDIDRDQNTTVRKGEVEVGGSKQKVTKGEKFKGSDVTRTDDSKTYKRHQTDVKTSKSSSSNKDFTADEDNITVKDQFSLVLICETMEDGSLSVKRDSSTQLGPIESGIRPKMKHDNDLVISFKLKTKELYN